MPKLHNEDILIVVGQRLRERRLRFEFTTRELAGQVGITRQQIEAYEQGRSDPPLCTIIRIADALDTTVDTLVAEPFE